VISYYLAQDPQLVVVSGGAAGVDAMAAEEAANLGIPPERIIVHWPNGKGWIYYKERNLRIVEELQKGDRLVRIWGSCSRTYGSGWTRDRAILRLGRAAVEEYGIDYPGPARKART
jgi:hypothetical protein